MSDTMPWTREDARTDAAPAARTLAGYHAARRRILCPVVRNLNVFDPDTGEALA